MRNIETLADFELVALEEISKAGIELEESGDALHVSVVKFVACSPQYTLSFTDKFGSDYNGRGKTPELAINSALVQHTSTDIKL